MNIDENDLSDYIKNKYTLKDNTLTTKPKDVDSDRIEIEVGDSKQADSFYPQVKIKRWDNEVNSSFRLIDTEEKTFETDENKIKLIGNKKEIHLYELSPSDDLPSGGYEFEVILKEKPKDNKIEFSIQTKELNFFYQPELTQDEVDNGAVRPDNVVGSYAVYHKTKNGNIKNGKHYKCGKAFHIYRPRIEDSKGTWVWGELSVDLENNKLIVTVPQKFLDEAVYPVKHAAGATFGYIGEGESSTEFNNSPQSGGSEFTGAAGTIDSISMYCNTSGSPGTDVAIYETDGDLVEGTTSAGFGPDGADWVTINLAGTTTISAISYVLQGKNYNAGLTLYYDAGDTNQGYYASNGMFSWDDPETFSNNDNKYSIYATYTAGGGEPATPTESYISTSTY